MSARSHLLFTTLLLLFVGGGGLVRADEAAKIPPATPAASPPPDLCEAFLYHPRKPGVDLEKRLAAVGGRRLTFKNDQGSQVAYWVPPKTQSGPLPDAVWIATAGNASLATDWLGATKAWSPRFGWLLVDYPGYGECEGRPHPDRIRANYRDAYAALVAELKTTSAEMLPRTGSFGHSLGAAAAFDGAVSLGVKRIVVLAPFTSLEDMAKRTAGRLSFLMTHRYDNRARLDELAAAGAKVALFHGTLDEVIPFSQGESLATRQPQVVDFHKVEGGRHNNLASGVKEEIGKALERMSGWVPAARR